MIRSVAFLFITALAAAAIVGCGGGDDSNSSSNGGGSGGGAETIATSSLSKAQFIEKAEEICGKESEEFLALISTYMSKHASDPNKSEGEVAAEGVQKTLLPKFQTQIDQIRALGAPAGDEKEVEAFLDAMQHAVDSLNKRSSIELEVDVDREFEHAGELALDYGIKECAN